MADVSQIVLKDANGNTIGTYNVKDTSVPHDSKSAASGGTTLSLVTTGEKYTWNNKMNKTNPTGSGSFHFSTGDSSNIGEYAIAMGFDSEARGFGSTAIGAGVIAKNAYQHVIGRFNVEDPGSSTPSHVGTYAEIVGNGSSSSSRSNARTLDWSGNEVLAGGLKINGTQDVASIDGMTEWKTSTTSFVSACNLIGIYSGIGNVLDNLKTNMSSYTNNSINTRVDTTQGPIYFIWFGKANNNYFTGMLLSYFDNNSPERKSVLFGYFNGTYQVRLI